MSCLRRTKHEDGQCKYLQCKICKQEHNQLLCSKPKFQEQKLCVYLDDENEEDEEDSPDEEDVDENIDSSDEEFCFMALEEDQDQSMDIDDVNYGPNTPEESDDDLEIERKELMKIAIIKEKEQKRNLDSGNVTESSSGDSISEEYSERIDYENVKKIRSSAEAIEMNNFSEQRAEIEWKLWNIKRKKESRKQIIRNCNKVIRDLENQELNLNQALVEIAQDNIKKINEKRMKVNELRRVLGESESNNSTSTESLDTNVTEPDSNTIRNETNLSATSDLPFTLDDLDLFLSDEETMEVLKEDVETIENESLTLADRIMNDDIEIDDISNNNDSNDVIEPEKEKSARPELLTPDEKDENCCLPDDLDSMVNKDTSDDGLNIGGNDQTGVTMERDESIGTKALGQSIVEDVIMSEKDIGVPKILSSRDLIKNIVNEVIKENKMKKNPENDDTSKWEVENGSNPQKKILRKVKGKKEDRNPKTLKVKKTNGDYQVISKRISLRKKKKNCEINGMNLEDNTHLPNVKSAATFRQINKEKRKKAIVNIDNKIKAVMKR